MVHKTKNSAKVTAEPSVYKGYAYYPIYEPTKSKNKCSLGSAFICAVDDECGQKFFIFTGQYKYK